MVSGDSEYHMRGHCISGGKRDRETFLHAGCVWLYFGREQIS